MSETATVAVSLREAIDTIEEAYEFMLAYAAQGRQQEAEADAKSAIRGYLERFRSALGTLVSGTDDMLPEGGGEGGAFAQHLAQDSETVESVIDLLLASDNITSDMIDNTNGLIVVRSFLTNLFFIDQVVLPGR